MRDRHATYNAAMIARPCVATKTCPKCYVSPGNGTLTSSQGDTPPRKQQIGSGIDKYYYDSIDTSYIVVLRSMIVAHSSASSSP